MEMMTSSSSSLNNTPDEEDPLQRHAHSQTLEIEDSTTGMGVEQSSHTKKMLSPLHSKLRYVGLSTLALVLALSCPAATALQRGKWYLAFKAILGYALTLASFFFLQGSDPGYLTPEIMKIFEEDTDCQSLLKRDNSPERKEGNQDQSQMTQRRPGNSEDNLKNKTEETSTFEGTRRRYCPLCRISPPLRAHHCKDCDKCVASFDHHCHFVGTCIAERNHCRFWWFLLVQAVSFNMACEIVGTSSYGIFTVLFPPAPPPPWSQVLHVVVAKGYLYPLRFCAWIMVLIHSWMAVTNSTTFELSKGPRHIDYLQGTKGCDLPFSTGMTGNLRVFCCAKDAATRKESLPWRPTLWQLPGKIVRDSENWWENPWQNKYWSCC